ncbi:MAG TPA: Nramp family divalent metal transporter, partial [Planctomycetota bacterium]|nr:Nramp family divalent metal transporter [Planctomycetota bacterium]
ATTAVGAEAGFWLLWLVGIGCVIKVFTQIELGRYTIVSGQTTLDALEDVPGPRIARRGNWLVWYWMVMFVASVGQLGGIIGGVGQALSISIPLTDAGRRSCEIASAETEFRVKRRAALLLVRRALESPDGVELPRDALLNLASSLETLDERAEGMALANLEEPLAAVVSSARSASSATTLTVIEEIGDHIADAEAAYAKARGLGERPEAVWDARLWAVIIATITAALLVVGRYGLIQSVSTVLVALFTFVTVATVLLLQRSATWHITWDELLQGLSFRLPPSESVAEGKKPLATALMAFGIIGVGATELVYYPYWCLERGYARFTGARSETSEWADRARGWLRVMRLDAWGSMLIYTFATIAFFLLGAATLGRIGLDAKGNEMVRTLAVMYEPVFGSWAPPVFLFGAFAVLYSTFFVANASNARVLADALRVVNVLAKDDRTNLRWVRILSGALPFVCLVIYLGIPEPKKLVLIGGAMQALMLPMLAGAALWFRYRRSDARLAPSRVWDAFLWLSGLAMLVAGGTLLVNEILRWV